MTWWWLFCINFSCSGVTPFRMNSPVFFIWKGLTFYVLKYSFCTLSVLFFRSILSTICFPAIPLQTFAHCHLVSFLPAILWIPGINPAESTSLLLPPLSSLFLSHLFLPVLVSPPLLLLNISWTIVYLGSRVFWFCFLLSSCVVFFFKMIASLSFFFLN